MAASANDIMADLENTRDKDFIPNILAYNLKYETISNISMMLCVIGALKNWRDVADELGFENREIMGHFDNFPGCTPARNMLNEWIFKRGGTVPKLVEVFKSLELYSCLEELRGDKGYQSALEYFKSGKDQYDGDSDSESSGTSSIDESTSSDAVKTDTDTQALELVSTEDKNQIQCNDSPSKQQKKIEIPDEKTEAAAAKSPASESALFYKSWPGKEFNRCNSSPSEKGSGKKTLFRRSKSEDSGKMKQKEAKDKQSKKKLRGWLSFKLRRHKGKSSHSKVVKVEGYYQEDKQTERTNLYPWQDEVPTSVGRPNSCGSEDSLPLQPPSPNSNSDYESGSEYEENQMKKIYIVCNPDEPDVFVKAYKMYAKFCKKGYECTMFATNFDEVFEIGQYRYQMEQVKDADYLFLCVSKELKRIFEESSKLFKGYIDDNCKSLRHVSDFIMAHLSRQCRNTNGKFMPILLAEDSHDHIPCFMGSYLSYAWPKQQPRMENTIHGRSDYPVIPVSNKRIQAPQKVFGLNMDSLS